MQVSAMRLALLIRESQPPGFVKLGKMGFVLCVDHVDRSAASNHDVGHEMPECSMARIGPVKRKDSLAKPAGFDIAAGYRSLAADNRFDVCLPKLIERQLPGESIEFPAASESALIDYPGDCFQSAPENALDEPATA